MPTATTSPIARFVDLERYPIHAPDSGAGQALIGAAHRMMACDTLVVLPGFLRERAVAELATELSALEPRAHRIDYESTAYGWMNNAGFAPGHPRSAMFRRNCGTITAELIAPGGAVATLFECDELTEFVRRLLGYPALYRSACPCLSIQVNTMGTGESFGWHFDTNDGVVSFVIRNAERGGEFEYQPLIRDEGKENYAAVARLFDGQDQPRRPALQAGTFTLFLGRRSVHRVTPVGASACSRLSLLYSYHHEPGMVFPHETCARITGSSNAPYRGALTPP